MDFNKQLEIEKKNKIKTSIGFIIFFILLGLAIFEYISSTFVLMLSIPIMAIIAAWNSLDDEKNSNNRSRVLLLAFFLIVISWNFYSLQIKNKSNANKIYSLCNKKIGNSIVCDEMNDILTPIEYDLGDD